MSHKVQKLICVCAVSSFSKEVQRGVCPDAARGPPGLLRGGSALPSAPHLDGQGDRGLRQRHVSVGEAETAMPKHRPEPRPLHRREGLDLRSSPPPPSPPADSAPRRHLKQTLKLRLSFLPSPPVLVSSPVTHIHTSKASSVLLHTLTHTHTHTETLMGPAVLSGTSALAAAFLTHLLLFTGSPSAAHLWAGIEHLIGVN